MERSRSPCRGARERRKTVSIVGEERWELWVYGYSTFVLEIFDFDIEAFDLTIKLTLLAGLTMKQKRKCTHESRRFFT